MAGLHHLGKELYQTAHIKDAWISPMSDLPVCPAEEDEDDCQGSINQNSSVSSNSVVNQPRLRRDPRVIRQQYLTQLGINLSSSALERSIGRKRQIEGIKVKLKGSDKSDARFRSSFLQAISNWYTGSESTSPDCDEMNPVSAEMEVVDSAPKRKVGFHEEAEVFLIPLHNEYTARQRKGMWHSREEFMSMVERNLEAMYEEMEREYEEQLRMEAEAEEARKLDSSPSSTTSSSSSVTPSTSLFANLEVPVPEVSVTKLARSPQQIRSKYLLQLGIDR